MEVIGPNVSGRLPKWVDEIGLDEILIDYNYQTGEVNLNGSGMSTFVWVPNVS